MMHPRDAAVVSFDCYGTLIDWQSGARAAIDAIPETRRRRSRRTRCSPDRGRTRSRARVLPPVRRSTRHLHPANLRGVRRRPQLRVRAVLRRLDRQLAAVPGRRRVSPPPGNCRNAASHPLQRHQDQPRRQRPQARRRLRQFVTAEDVESYKPDHDHWNALHESRDIIADQQLHIAGSIAHDIRPASELGATTVWVRRAHEPIPDDVRPDLIVQSLAELGDYWRLFYSR